MTSRLAYLDKSAISSLEPAFIVRERARARGRDALGVFNWLGEHFFFPSTDVSTVGRLAGIAWSFEPGWVISSLLSFVSVPEMLWSDFAVVRALFCRLANMMGYMKITLLFCSSGDLMRHVLYRRMFEKGNYLCEFGNALISRVV